VGERKTKERTEEREGEMKVGGGEGVFLNEENVQSPEAHDQG